MFVLQIWIFVVGGISLTNAETRYACLRNRALGAVVAHGGRYAMYPGGESSSEDMDEENGSSMLSGHLSCADKPNTLILVTLVIYGYGGMYASCGSPNEYCDDIVYTKSTVGSSCDRKVRCMPRIPSRFLPRCVVKSNFIHVEYECVDPWAVFEVCYESDTAYKGSTVFIVSPTRGVAPTASCECILKDRHRGKIRMDYTHSNMEQMDCDVNNLVFETKSRKNQTGIETETKVCGRKTERNKMYIGSLRLTYNKRKRYRDDGFLSKMSVKPTPNITITVQCGPVTSPTPNAPVTSGSRPLPPRMYPRHHGPPTHPYYNYPPYRPPYPNRQHSNNISDSNYYDMKRWGPPFYRGPYYSRYGPSPQSSNNSSVVGNNTQISSSNSTSYQPGPRPYWELDLFSKWEPPPPRTWPQNNRPQMHPQNMDLFYDQRDRNVLRGPRIIERPLKSFDKPNKIAEKKAVPTLSNLFEAAKKKPQRLPSTVQFIGRNSRTARRNTVSPSAKPAVLQPNSAKRELDSTDDGVDHVTEIGRQVAYVVGGVGAILCAGGAVIIVLRLSKRRKQLPKDVDTKPTNGQNIEERAIYTLPDQKLSSLQVHVNSAYHGSTVNPDMIYIDESDPYNTVFEVNAQKNSEQAESSSGQKYRPDVCYSQPKRCTPSIPNPRQGDERIYDNNI